PRRRPPGGMAYTLAAQVSEVDRLRRGEHRQHVDLLSSAAPASQAPEEHEHARAAQRGATPAYACGADLSQRRQLLAVWSALRALRRTKAGSRTSATSTWSCCAEARKDQLRNAG